MGIKSKSMLVSYYDCDKDSKLRPSTVLRYFAEISTRDEDRGFKNIKKMDSLGYGWMLAKWKVEINKYPKTGDEIIIKTWVSEVNKFYVYREYIIEDKEGKKLIKGSGLWIFLDINKRKVLRVTEEFFDTNYIINEKNFNSYKEFDETLNYELESCLKVRRSDIDANKHVNNLKYLDWIIESVSEEIYIGYTISKFDIHYKKEIKYPADIEVKKISKEKDGEIIIIHSISEKHKDKINCFIESTWTKNRLYSVE